ncbi:MAG: integrase [Alphaproteobacteria bacterium CG11_big_fil_rev_8_21_14_0_20_39_49]|nr:MAG: integrase [Alphaproteobacteria bacterium CG11_big_fil_rev_8_21_14_0_20_39_49]
MPKLTKRNVESAAIKEKPYFLFDDQITGFCVRISPSGKRHYYLQYLKYKTVKRFALGQHGVLTVENARNKAIAMLASIKDGGDPQKEKEEKLKEPIVRELAKRYMDEHVKVHCKPSTTTGYQRYLDKHILPMLGYMKVSEVTRKDIANMHHHLRNIPYEANRCLEVVSKMFNLAELWGLRPDGTNPRRHIKKYPMKSRERYLSKEEAKRLGEVLDEIKCYPDENLSAVYCIQLLLLTGCRLGEVQTLKWEYIDYENAILRLPDSKTGAKIIYAGDVVINLLEEIRNHPARPIDNPYVIWGRNAGAYINNIQKPWRRFRTMAGLEDVRIHDLRHSFASFAVSKGMSLPMIGKLLGHTQVQTTARYAHIMAEPLKAAAGDVTGELSSLMKINNVSVQNKPLPPKPNKSIIAGTTIQKPVYLTSDQAAEYLGVHPRLMENWRWRKTGPDFVKVGNRIRYKLENLEGFVEKEDVVA